MKKLYLFLLLIFPLSLSAQLTNTAQLLDAMQIKHRGKWFKTLTFQQETIRYREGQKSETSIWNEAVRYPDHFRIDYLNSGRTVVFKSDSAYRFEKGEFQAKLYQPQEFLLFKGGLYFISRNEVLKKLQDYGYNTSIFRKDRLNGMDVYVVGGKEGDLTSKQFWLNADHFYIVRRISQTSSGATLDVQYEDHERYDGGWVEHKVTFYLNGRLIQVENYLDIKVNMVLNDSVFDSSAPIENWYK